MSAGTFTPGPWKVVQRSSNEMMCSFVGVVVGDDLIEMPGPQSNVGTANARLISAAPDLLEALIELVQEFDITLGNRGNPDTTEIRRARAAIAKAIGEAA